MYFLTIVLAILTLDLHVQFLRDIGITISEGNFVNRYMYVVFSPWTVLSHLIGRKVSRDVVTHYETIRRR